MHEGSGMNFWCWMGDGARADDTGWIFGTFDNYTKWLVRPVVEIKQSDYLEQRHKRNKCHVKLNELQRRSRNKHAHLVHHLK